MRVLLSLVVAGLFIAAPLSADACSCMAASPCQQVAAADAVFVGDVLEVAEPGSGRKLVTMRVVRGHKGTPKADETVTVAMPRGSSASCSLDAVVGARLVIFATVRDGTLSTNLCSGSHTHSAGRRAAGAARALSAAGRSRRSGRPGVSGVARCIPRPFRPLRPTASRRSSSARRRRCVRRAPSPIGRRRR